MKKGIRKAAGSVVFLAGLCALLIFVSYLFLPKNNMAEFGMDEVTANGILGEKENSIDVLVVGDSESYSAISPMEMWAQQGFTSYVCGTSGQYLYLSDTFLKRAFEKQQPKVVILETDAIYRDVTFGGSFMNRLENLFSVFRYHNRWKSIGPGELFSSVEYTWTDDYKGYSYNAAVDAGKNEEHMNPTDHVAEIKELNEEYVAGMAQFCKDNGAVFLLVSTPSTVNWNYERHNGVQQLADKYGIPYIDLNLMKEEVPIDWTTDTRDKGDHLNHSGAVKVSAWLGKYLKEQYSLPDHRNDSAYAKWTEALDRYKKAVGQA